MTKIITNSGRWKPGHSGNPKGRPLKGRALTEVLEQRGKEVITIGGEEVTAQEALAKAVWDFVLCGEVWLSGRRLAAENITEWANVVKWLYSHVEPASKSEAERDPELVVRVVRADKKRSGAEG